MGVLGRLRKWGRKVGRAVKSEVGYQVEKQRLATRARRKYGRENAELIALEKAEQDRLDYIARRKARRRRMMREISQPPQSRPSADPLGLDALFNSLYPEKKTSSKKKKKKKRKKTKRKVVYYY